ncbi:unnamed protein product [Clonostachys rosea]|uniref:Zn(2)-C6 fungal-type domain-containing protein n=1 Tax=Bionectria ochroleuca TaxID=29856 RepID=A0ABY6URH2_BIOOC|nr:unnamed protein product [Clonostachys rosea]
MRWRAGPFCVWLGLCDNGNFKQNKNAALEARVSHLSIRIRRVKCDEKTPSCTRCTSTGRSCEWIGVFRDGLSQAKPRMKPQQPLPTFPDVRALELRGFEFFQQRTAREMCPSFEFGFWTSLVLQLSRSEPAVLHAAVALGVLHETEESLGMPISKDRLAHNENHKFAVGQYNAAIRLLTEQAQGGSRTATSVLATCLIFVHIDLMRGLYQAAGGHIRSGLKILEESEHVLPHDVSRMMRTGFCRLDLQAAHFDAEAPYYQLPVELATLENALNRPFRTIENEKEQYDILIYHTFQLLRKCEGNVLKNRWEHLSDQALKAQQQKLLHFHDKFIQNCSVLAADQQALLLLRMHALLTQVLIRVCMARDIEGAFEEHIFTFENILVLAEEFVSNQTKVDGLVSRVGSFSTDWGIIFPLTLTALKCRVGWLRRKAINLLEARKHREGFWDSALAATCCRELVSLEIGEEGTIQQLANIWVDIPNHQRGVTLTWESQGARSRTVAI